MNLSLGIQQNSSFVKYKFEFLGGMSFVLDINVCLFILFELKIDFVQCSNSAQYFNDREITLFA